MIVDASVYRPEISHSCPRRKRENMVGVDVYVCVLGGGAYLSTSYSCNHKLHIHIYVYSSTGPFMDREYVIATGLMYVLRVVKTTHLCGLLSVARDVTTISASFLFTQSYKLKAHWELPVRSCQTVA